MADSEPAALRFSLQRWSQRKLAAARAAEALPPAAADAVTPTTVTGVGTQAAPPATTAANPALQPASPMVTGLPAVESLSFESDFSVFLQPEVDATVRRQALKRLFADPRFNVMDGLDVYIDDYGKPDPIAPDLVRQLVQGRYLFDPPRTRVNAQGQVEEVPPDEEGVPRPLEQAAGGEVVAPAEISGQAAAPAETEAAAQPAATSARSEPTLPAEPRP